MAKDLIDDSPDFNENRISFSRFNPPDKIYRMIVSLSPGKNVPVFYPGEPG
jgi:hypothetical protein